MSKRHKPEEIVGKLREAEIVLAQGGTTADACRRIGAGMTLPKGDLAGIVRARQRSEVTMSNICQNLFFTFIYNAAGVPVAAGLSLSVLSGSFASFSL